LHSLHKKTNAYLALVVSFDRDSNKFLGIYLENKLKSHDCELISLCTYLSICCLNYPFMSSLIVDSLMIVMVVFVLLNLFMNEIHGLCETLFFSIT
jgi:hypothetical protein